MISNRALSGRNGIIGFVPRDAFDSTSTSIVIEVIVEFDEGESAAICVKTSMLELQERLRWTAARDLCDWLRERASMRASMEQPLRKLSLTQSGKISWRCHGPSRKEPFLRF
ncbi:hypothetical protein BH09CHL1_BH09CHL1_06520 [soil metagenome]